MKVTSLFVCMLLFVYVLETRAHITIQIESNEIPKIAEILRTALQQNHNEIQAVQSRARFIFHLCLSVLPFLKFIARGTGQIAAIIFTLVGANLITYRLETSITSNQMTAITSNQMLTINKRSPSTSELICKNSFGCASKYCWKSCGEENEKNIQRKWCLTTRPNETTFEACVDENNCSSCWPCLSRCQPITNP